MAAAVGRARLTRPLGAITEIAGGRLIAGGLADKARLGDRVEILSPGIPAGIPAEVIRVSNGEVLLLAEGSTEGVGTGTPVRLCPPPSFAPDDSWIGRVVDPDGRPLDGRPLLPGTAERKLAAAPPAPAERRALGSRMATGFALFDTLLPLVRGQRVGLFAGSGVGKSTLLAGLARNIEAEVVVIGLVGERGRELRHFVEAVLGPEGMARSVVVAATSDRAPQVRRRCALAATAVAEHFRAEGCQVLLLLDSVTRFAEAHRELAVSSGESAGLRGFPPSTGGAIAALCERAGPGVEEEGDITAIYSVLVAGSDMEEPVADMLRGVLDGHVVLDRAIAERGRFPAVDVLRSVSRSLPDAASDAENLLIGEARARLGAYDRAELMIQAGLYAKGSDPEIDAAIATHQPLEAFFARKGPDTAQHFAALGQALAAGKAKAK
ncbi:FliI/YscN family ATPase [Pseudoroseicyclus sp. CXY001]|uniref:FliI/YscN family ATPase n=1 Tax=Pseudoroseicyclus sp. CXY001 TaxID=3242492 RepID=UPI00358DA23B